MNELNRRAPAVTALPEEDVYVQKISVPFEYPVYFTHGLFKEGNPVFASALDRLHEQRRHRAMVCLDAGVARAHPGLTNQIKTYFHDRADVLELAGPPEIVPGGEGAKNGWDVVRDIMETIGNQHLCRQSFIIAIGGGSVLDAVGFATSLVHRGLRMVRVPTTVLAQNDAGVGVKNGMNKHGMKNFVGTFAPPFAVLNDFTFLPTLTKKDWTGGMAEAFKVAIIKDAEFFEFLCQKAENLQHRDEKAMEVLVRQGAILHLEHIRNNGDPFEFGPARPLDFGHWAAHKIEALSGYTIGHGQAVAIGIALDTCYATGTRLLTTTERDRVLNGLTRCGLPLWHDLLEKRTSAGRLCLLEGLEQFREHLGGTLAVTLPKGIGARCEVHWMNVDLIEDAVRYLKRMYY